MKSKHSKKIAAITFLLIAFAIPFITYVIVSRNTDYDDRSNAQGSKQGIFTEGLGLGYCHSLGLEYRTNSGVLWGYSSGIPFSFKPGQGDNWAAVETEKGVYNFSQIRGEVDLAKSLNKNLWIQLQVADSTNKERNVPKWALDEGIEVYPTTRCNDDSYLSYKTTPWDDGTAHSVKNVWNDPTHIDQSEAILLDADGKVTADLSKVKSVKLPNKIAAVWDPKFRDYYEKALDAMKTEFTPELESGLIQAVNLMSGGRYGECAFAVQCAAWEEHAQTCTPDVLNPDCPVIKSMAKFVQKQHYPEMTVEQVARDIVAKKSNCDPSNVVPGKKVQLCTESDITKCPMEYSSYCFVFDDYFIQAEKDLISRYVKIFSPTPVVWQTGSGLSGTGRVNKVLENWMDTTFGSAVWMKFNGWGPSAWFFGTRNFSQYGKAGARGYEPGHPNSFSSSYFKENADEWCAEYLSKACKGDNSCLPQECKAQPLDTDAVGRRAIVVAIERGIIGDKSSYLCMQGSFFADTPTDVDGDQLFENKYFFNPNDQSETCSSSEINVTKYGVGFCPGFLNKVMKDNAPKTVNYSCTPNCTGKECGPNGCGGNCGTCPTNEQCTTQGICIESSNPDPDPDPDPDPTNQKSADLNNDSRITVTDYAIFIADYKKFMESNQLTSRSDLNSDGTISVTDYSLFIKAYLQNS